MESLDISPFFSHFAALFGSLTYCLIITCNMTVLLTIALDRQLHKPMYLLLINLPINDMIGATALFPHLIHRWGICFWLNLLLYRTIWLVLKGVLCLRL
jgi:olfactory receptor